MKAELVPNLWIGSWPTAADLAEADLVLNVHGGDTGGHPKVLSWPIDDEDSLPDDRILHVLGRMIADCVSSGTSVLIHCHMAS